MKTGHCRLLNVLVFLLLFGSFAYFQHSEPGWNVNSRFALTLALAETGSAEVDRYVTRPGLATEDLAQYEGHLYSDKSIGTSLLGVPAVWVVESIEAIADTTFSTATRRYLVSLLSVGLAAALSGVLLMRFLALLWSPADGFPGRNATGAATFAAIAVTLGSMLFLYGTLFMSYLPAHLFLVAALLTLEKALRLIISPSLGARVSPLRSSKLCLRARLEEMKIPLALIFFAGTLAGLSALCEYTYAIAPAFMGVYLLARIARRAKGKSDTSALPSTTALVVPTVYILGGLIGIAPFLIYTYSIFGRFAVPYEYHVMPQFRAAMCTGFMGATWPPDADVLWLITFHPFRGIFVYSPLLLLGILGLVWMTIRDKPRRAFACLSLACIAFYLLFNSAYYMWWGGWSFAPRHLAPAIPFTAAGLWPWLQRRWGRWLAAATALAGVAVHTLVNATEPQPPDGGWQTALLRPDLTAFDYPSVFLHDTWRRVIAGALDSNIGILMGLPQNCLSLLPLALWWIIMCLLIRATFKGGIVDSHGGNSKDYLQGDPSGKPFIIN